ncbi:MAG: uroporphyrinogen-III C-methyltransferase [Acidimicrobiia bacterium]|nr:uroporphyrinogen-III C-methyltransferase [Acidimicrobiia bacterium]
MTAVTAPIVHIVGAGPGDPELLTLKAARLLATAEVVVHDRLVAPRILALVPPEAERIDVGKRPGRPLPQELVDALLVELGRAGRRIVRLKGGDPFVFGRGGEEARALAAAGVPFEVVPGISAALGVPAYAGIPVTHRGLAASFTVVTGRRAPGWPDVDWKALARVGGTLVILMGVARRAEIAARLVGGGLPGRTPVAAVRWGTRDDQMVWRTTLAELGAAPVEGPATIVVGEVAALDLTWFRPAGLAAVPGEGR